MEILFGLVVIGAVFYVISGFRSRDKNNSQSYKPKQSGDSTPRRVPPKTRTVQRTPVPKPYQAPTRPQADMPVIEGPAYVIDGDSLRIKGTEIRIYGVDAPELNHPYGKKAKWAMVNLCKGHQVRAKIIEQDGHGRAVAMCYLPDGRDLSEEMVKQGLALDWPKYSQGDYRMFEPPGVRKKLWLAAARQKGHMHVWAKFDATQKARAADQAK